MLKIVKHSDSLLSIKAIDALYASMQLECHALLSLLKLAAVRLLELNEISLTNSERAK